MATPPIPAARKQGNLLWWLLGFAGAGILILIVGGLVIAGLLVRNIRVHRGGREVEIHTPGGDLKVSRAAAIEVGLPIYPGATLAEPGKNVELSLPTERQVGITVARYRAPDPLEKVDAWYRARLGAEFERQGPGAKQRKIKGVDLESDGIAYVSERGDLVRFVALKERGAGVDIALGRVGQREAQ